MLYILPFMHSNAFEWHFYHMMHNNFIEKFPSDRDLWKKRGDTKLYLFAELSVPSQAVGVVGPLIVMFLYHSGILNTISGPKFNDAILFLQCLLLCVFPCTFKLFC